MFSQKKAIINFILLIIVVNLIACGQNQKSVSDNETVLEIISSNSVSACEADYTLVVEYPETMVEASTNIPDNWIVYSEFTDDHSFIHYEKTDRDINADYNSLDSNIYGSYLSDALGTEVEVVYFELSEDDDVIKIKLSATYSRNDVEYELTEYIYVTDRSVYYADYCLDVNSTYGEQFKELSSSLDITR